MCAGPERPRLRVARCVLTTTERNELQQSLAKNVKEHAQESAASCESFHCGEAGEAGEAYEPPEMDRYAMGPVPSNDFPMAFTAREEQIFVSRSPYARKGSNPGLALCYARKGSNPGLALCSDWSSVRALVWIGSSQPPSVRGPLLSPYAHRGSNRRLALL